VSIVEVAVRGRSPYRLLALMAIALIAAGALVVGPLVARARHSSPEACLGPGDPGTFSVGKGIASGVVALTEQPGTHATTPVSIQMLNVPVADAAVSELWISGPGAAPTALSRHGTGCWMGSVPPSVLTSATLRLSPNATAPVYMRFVLPADPVSGAALMALARRNTLHLEAVREVTSARPSMSAPPQWVISTYSGATVVSHSSDGTQSFSWPGWRTGFEWVTPGIDASLVLGTAEFDGQKVVQVAGAVIQTPLWMVFDIVPRTGQVLWDSMNGPNHVMTNRLAPLTR
jgi:hypothetical protein